MRAKIILKLDETCLSAKYRAVEVAKKKLVQALLEALASSGEIKILEIHVVALKSGAATYVSSIATEGRREAVLKH